MLTDTLCQFGYVKCTRSNSPLFTAGVVYEVHSFDEHKALLATERETGLAATNKVDADFVPHDPWAGYRRSLQAGEQPWRLK